MTPFNSESEAGLFVARRAEQMLDVAARNALNLVGMPNSHPVVLRDFFCRKGIKWSKR
jgi:hypothetical protein